MECFGELGVSQEVLLCFQSIFMLGPGAWEQRVMTSGESESRTASEEHEYRRGASEEKKLYKKLLVLSFLFCS